VVVKYPADAMNVTCSLHRQACGQRRLSGSASRRHHHRIRYQLFSGDRATWPYRL